MRWVDIALSLDRATHSLGLSKPVLFVSGFWRSGTTWLQEYLASGFHAKTIFEPLSPLIEARDLMLREGFPDSSDNREALIPGPADRADSLWPYIDSVVAGKNGGHIALACRRKLDESLRTKIILKDVRLQFNLTAVNERYGVPVIHINRHPCAVVRSLMMAKWDWTFDNVSLVDLGWAIGMPTLERVGLDIDRLAQFNDDPLSRIATLWAITEKIADLDLRGKAWATIVAYEDLVTNPTRIFEILSSKYGLNAVAIPNSEIESPVTHPENKGTTSSSKVERWKTALTPAQIDRIAQIVNEIHPDYSFRV